MRSALVAALVCATAAAGAVWPWYPAPSVSIDRAASTARVEVSNPLGSITVDVVPATPALRRFIEYDDARYARGRGMSDRFANGLIGHVAAALRYRGVTAGVDLVDAYGLARLLAGDPHDTCLIVPGGILPDTVRRRGHDALRPFIERGGAVVWAGAPFDAYFSTRATDGRPAAIAGPDTSVWPDLYGRGGISSAGADPRSPPLRFASSDAPLRMATGLTFDKTTFAVNAVRLAQFGGAAIAYLDERGDSSVSVLRIGRGRVVLFADAFDDELQAANEIAQTVATGAWFDPQRVRVATTLDASRTAATLSLPHGTRAFAFGDPPYFFPFGD